MLEVRGAIFEVYSNIILHIFWLARLSMYMFGHAYSCTTALNSIKEDRHELFQGSNWTTID